MANVDVFAQSLVLWVLVPIFLMFLTWQLFMEPLKAVYRRVAAYMFAKSIHTFDKKIGRDKQKLFANLSDFLRSREDGGNLLEIGAGGGANFNYFPEGCTVTCVDKNEYSLGHLQKNAARNPHFKYNGLIVSDVRDMKDHVEHESVDAVVSTLLLCSVRDADKVLNEVLRILKPGGRFYFVEHVAAPKKTWVRFFQNKLTPLWIAVSDCELNMETEKVIRASDFADVTCHTTEKGLGGWGLADYVLYGFATK